MVVRKHFVSNPVRVIHLYPNSKIAFPIVIGEEDILALYRASQKVIGEEDILALYRASQKEILVLNLKRKIS